MIEFVSNPPLCVNLPSSQPLESNQLLLCELEIQKPIQKNAIAKSTELGIVSNVFFIPKKIWRNEACH